MDDHAARGAGLLDAVAGAAGSAPEVTLGLLAARNGMDDNEGAR